jgi:spore coat polysaccharide biosynthesis predicted glycosyltransferase SpsG
VIRCPVKVYPCYARADGRIQRNLDHFSVSQSKSLGNGHVRRTSPLASNHQPKRAFSTAAIGHVRRTSPLASNHLPKRAFSTAAINAFRLLKMLKHA